MGKKELQLTLNALFNWIVDESKGVSKVGMAYLQKTDSRRSVEKKAVDVYHNAEAFRPS